MTLRVRMLMLFLALAVVPLLLLGAVVGSRSFRALKTLIAGQNASVAARVAATIEQRAAMIESDLALLSENVETQRWLAAGARDSAALRSHDQFVHEAWRQMGTAYASVSYRDADGALLYRLGDPDQPSETRNSDAIVRPIRLAGADTILGSIEVHPILRAIIPADVLAAGFGRTGHGLVLDRNSHRVVFPAEPTLQRATPGEWPPNAFRDSTGTFQYRAQDTLRIASYRMIQGMPWIVVESGAVDEFATPFATLGRNTLLLFLGVAALVTLVFNQLLRRTTRSLEDLTRATAVVAQGDFAPRLPPAGRDEVGRLTAAFGAMADKLGETLAEVRSSRQMAVLGEFAAHLSHEVRNPLTSIKLNLQKLDRKEREGQVPSSLAVPLGIALREVARLEQVVRGVLELTRSATTPSDVASLHQVIGEAIEVVLEQAQSSSVRIDQRLEACRDQVGIDSSAVKGAVINILLNGIEAMPGGGILTVATATAPGEIRAIVSDTGPGVPLDLRTRIFQPFFSRREGGTGLGLALARQAIEESGGVLSLGPPKDHGAEFIIRFPTDSRA